MIFIKHVRNKIKTYYTKEDKCYICGSKRLPEFHHLLCLSVQAQRILRNYGYRDYPELTDPKFDSLVWKIAEDPDIKHPSNFYTLCQECHKQLHKIYGQAYTAWKPVKNYIEKQREKHGN